MRGITKAMHLHTTTVSVCLRMLLAARIWVDNVSGSLFHNQTIKLKLTSHCDWLPSIITFYKQQPYIYIYSKWMTAHSTKYSSLCLALVCIGYIPPKQLSSLTSTDTVTAATQIKSPKKKKKRNSTFEH